MQAANRDPFWLENIEEARRMPLSEKFLAGADLFDFACKATLAGIRHENSGISDDGALEILRARLDAAERLEVSCYDLLK
jgi:hypothetical protein